MPYNPDYFITPKITHLIVRIGEAVSSLTVRENLRLHRINRIRTIQCTLAIEGNTLAIRFRRIKLQPFGRETRS